MRLWNEVVGRIRHRGDPYTCQQAVELVTEYIEGAMDEDERERFEHHLRVCPPCVTYVEQVRHTADVLGHVHPAEPHGAAREALLREFRDFRRE